MAESRLEAVRADEDVVPTSRVRELEAKVRELDRFLGRKTMEAEIHRAARSRQDATGVGDGGQRDLQCRPCHA